MSLRKLYISGLFLFLLSGCSGGGGSSDSSFVETPANTQTIAGFVEDGPVAGAKVYLVEGPVLKDVTLQEQAIDRCWASGVGRCETTTDDQGHFTLHLAAGAAPADYLIVCEGGVDHHTGISYGESAMGFMAPLSAFSDALKNISVSPLTTLLSDLMQQNHDLGWSMARLAVWTGLSSQEQILVQPSRDYPSLKKNLVVVALLLQLKENADNAPLDLLRDHLESGQALFDQAGRIDRAELLAHFLLSPDQADALVTLDDELDFESTADAAYLQLNRHLVSRILAGELDRFLAKKDPDNFDAADGFYVANRDALFGEISVAAGAAIPLWDWTPHKILQHVLLNYHVEGGPESADPLTEFQTYQVKDSDTFLARLVSFDGASDGVAFGLGGQLSNDVRIKEIASGQPQHLVVHALAEDERLSMSDNLARVRYYYNSDLSHLMRADNLARTILDDLANDALMVKLVKGAAEAGMVKGWVDDDLFPTDLGLLIENRIIGSDFRAQGYIKLASEAARWELFSQAEVALEKARGLLEANLDPAFFSDKDAVNFRELAQAYLDAGDFLSAIDLFHGLHQRVSGASADFKTYAQLFSSGTDFVDYALDKGDVSTAASVVDQLRNIAFSTPVSFTSRRPEPSYDVRVFHLVETARRYARVGQYQDVLDLYHGSGGIAELRTNDGLAANKTGVNSVTYMDEMAQPLFQAGDVAEAFALLDALSSKSRAKGYKFLATSIALVEAGQGGLLPPHAVEPVPEEMNALDLVEFKVPTDTFNATQVEAKIDALTYFVKSRSIPHISLSLINQGFADAAEFALDRATMLVRTLDDNQSKPYNLGYAKIDFGLAKIADLYIDLGMDETARMLLEEAEKEVLPNLVNADLINKSLTKLAEVYLRLGDAVAADRLLAQGQAGFSLDSYQALIEALFRIHSPEIGPYVDDYAALANDLFLNGGLSDKELASVVNHMVRAAGFYSASGEQQAAIATLDLAQEVALAVQVESKRIERLIDWATGYATIGEHSRAMDAVRTIESEGFSASRNDVFLEIGLVYAERNDLGDRDVAVVDLDKDGQPDFFHPLATAAEIQASGLVMDDDSDGDGIPDDQDGRPMYFDRAQ